MVPQNKMSNFVENSSSPRPIKGPLSPIFEEEKRFSASNQFFESRLLWGSLQSGTEVKSISSFQKLESSDETFSRFSQLSIRPSRGLNSIATASTSIKIEREFESKVKGQKQYMTLLVNR